MPRQLWIPDVLRRAGVDVYVMPGAEGCGSVNFAIDAIIWHHTATGPNWADGHVAALLRDGRRDLAGPLSQVGVERDGTWVIVALGRANHNGYGIYGNRSLGLEFYNSGLGEPWPKAQVESGLLGIGAIRDYIAQTENRAIPLLGHKESDPKRKPDPQGLDMNDIRRRADAVQRTIRHGLGALLKDGAVEAEVLACILYRLYLGRDPESLQVIAQRAEQIRTKGATVALGEIVHGDEGKAFAKKERERRAWLDAQMAKEAA